VARNDDPRYIRAVRVGGGEVCGGPRRLGAGEDRGRAGIEVEDDEVDEAKVDGVPLGRAAWRCTVRRCAVEGAAREEVAERGRRCGPCRRRLALRPVLAVDDTPSLVEVALLRRLVDVVFTAQRALVALTEYDRVRHSTIEYDRVRQSTTQFVRVGERVSE